MRPHIEATAIALLALQDEEPTRLGASWGPETQRE